MANKGGVQEGRQLLALGNTEGTGCSLREKQRLHPGSVHSPHSGVPSHSFSTNDKPSGFCYGSQNFNHVKTQIAQYPSMSTGPMKSLALGTIVPIFSFEIPLVRTSTFLHRTLYKNQCLPETAHSRKEPQAFSWSVFRGQASVLNSTSDSDPSEQQG